MGYTRRDIEDSLTENKYDSITATYLLLGRPSLDVSNNADNNDITVCVCGHDHSHGKSQ